MESLFSADKNIVITGFMGTGKSTVGRIVAARLHRPFVDMDVQIEAHFGKAIPQIFADEGEARFRAMEASLCQQLAQRTGQVIATGGGALVNAESRQVLANSGTLICLTATADAILDRLDHYADRPLMVGSRNERRAKIDRLLAQRRAAYAAIPHQVDTTGCTPEQVADRVLVALEADAEVAGMTRISVRTPAGHYHICIGEGLLEQAGTLLAHRRIDPGPVAVVTNPDISCHHGEQLSTGLRTAGFLPTFCTIPEGEKHKTLHSVTALYGQFLEAGLDRHSTVIALGGGVIGDVAGFAAATYLRGISFVQVPTSLLAMVDSSVGGKTGVDLPQGKNLVGAFKQPEVVLVDPAVLSTLPGVEFRSGLAEVVKHGIIGAPELFRQLEHSGPTSLGQLVADAVQVKVDVVQADPFEQGRRAVLNLGHTFGHAIELVSDFQVRHGEGVAIGLVASARLALAVQRAGQDLLDRVTNLLERLELPTHLDGYAVDSVYAAMAHDKKRRGRTLRFVIPHAVGDVSVIDDPGPCPVHAALAHILD